MATYVTDTELEIALGKKIDKVNIATAISNSPQDDKVVSEKLLDTKIKEVKIPQNLCECLNDFDNMYMGYKATHPTTDINGSPLSTGLMYWNTTDKQLYIYDGNMWQKTVSTTPTQTQQPFTLSKFDILVTSVTKTVVVTNGYNKDNIRVFLNGLIMSTADYTATDGSTIVFTDDLAIDDVVSGFSVQEDVLRIFDIEVTTNTDTVNVGAYDTNSINVFLNGVIMSTADYTATDGTNVIFGSNVSAGDVVSGFSVKDSSNTSVQIVTEYASKTDLPAIGNNGALALTLDDGKLWVYSANLNAWVGYGDNDNSTGGDIGFYDKYEDFDDNTVAKTDKLYVDRATRRIYTFNGTAYEAYGVITGEFSPSIAQMNEGALYVNSTKGTISIKKGNSIITLADGKKEPIQEKGTVGDFLYTGKENLFLDTTNHRLYHYDGNDFLPKVSAGAGGVEFVPTSASVGNTENTLFVEKTAGKTYYYHGGLKRRANKEIWRIPTDADLQNNALRDEDFIYLVDDTNLLKKWDAGTSRFETLGSSKVVHHFAKDTDITYSGDIPNKTEAKTYATSKGYTDCILWGNATDSSTPQTTWAYSVDEGGNVVLLYSNVDVLVNSFCTIPTEQTIGADKLEITIEAGNNITVKDGNGVVLTVADKATTGNLSEAGGRINVSINGVKIPYIDITVSGNIATVQTGRTITDSTLYVDNFIEVNK